VAPGGGRRRRRPARRLGVVERRRGLPAHVAVAVGRHLLHPGGAGSPPWNSRSPR
jgi:hypothetical protein